MTPFALHLDRTAADIPPAEGTDLGEETPIQTGPQAPADTPEEQTGGQDREETSGGETDAPAEGAGSSPEETAPPAQETGSQSPAQDGENSREEMPAQDAPLPQQPAASQDEGEGADSQTGQLQLTQEAALTAATPREAAFPLFPLLGVILLAALLLTAAALWLRRRRTAVPPPSAGTGGSLRWASLHQMGAREDQQDAFCLAGQDAPEAGLFAAVADGMGGLVNSGQMSAALVQALEESFAPDAALPPSRQLQLLFRRGLRRVEEMSRSSTAQSGSTLVCCLVQNGGLSWLSVGDSRIYLWRSGGLIQLNRDHDFHHDLVLLALQGDLELEEADQDPRRENLTSFLGRGFPRKVEWNQEPVPLLRGDRVLLVSDGVYRALSLEEMACCLRGGAKSSVQALRQAVEAKAFPHQDNYTAVVLEVR